jgi:hypothetical protein
VPEILAIEELKKVGANQKNKFDSFKYSTLICGNVEVKKLYYKQEGREFENPIR